MRRRSAQAMLAAMLLAGCGGEPAATDNAAEAENLQALENRLDAAMDPLVELVSLGAIREAGHPCEAIAATGAQIRHQGALVWTARCSDGGEWTIQGNDDGSHRVMTPAEAQASGVPAGATAAGE